MRVCLLTKADWIARIKIANQLNYYFCNSLFRFSFQFHVVTVPCLKSAEVSSSPQTVMVIVPEVTLTNVGTQSWTVPLDLIPPWWFHENPAALTATPIPVRANGKIEHTHTVFICILWAFISLAETLSSAFPYPSQTKWDINVSGLCFSQQVNITQQEVIRGGVSRIDRGRKWHFIMSNNPDKESKNTSILTGCSCLSNVCLLGCDRWNPATLYFLVHLARGWKIQTSVSASNGERTSNKSCDQRLILAFRTARWCTETRTSITLINNRPLSN